MRRFITNVHSKLMGVSPDALPGIYFGYLATFKTLVIIFNLVPYIALKLMS